MYRWTVEEVRLASDEEKDSDARRDLAGALHDVSNALTVMLGWVSEARHAGAPPEAVGYALRIIEERGRAARDLARRAIGVDAPPIDEAEPLDEVLRATVDALVVEAQKVHVSLQLVAADTKARILGASELSQIVTNLMLNAIAFSPHGGTVRVRTRVTGDHVEIEVDDEGPGVPVSRRHNIFEGGSTRRGGAGVGLRYSHALARANGADLVLLEGACFRVVWPRDRRDNGVHLIAPDTYSSAPPSAARPRTLDGVRILLLEDDSDVCTLLEASLGARGADITVAHNEAELDRAIAGGTHDAALLDLSPIAADVDGALARLRARSPGATVVFITGSVDRLPAALTEAPAGAASPIVCVRKPFELSEVLEALGRPSSKTRS
jgi:CheY-like chemotaxis protein/anti-sigma regulatory factor (Ser/Thr protein kinase)